MRNDYDYLIVGGGMAADAAAKGIREQDPDGTIGIVGEEPIGPVARPPLSKDLWTSADASEQDAALDTVSETSATLHTEELATRLDRDAKVVTTDSGEEFGYGTLLIATGGHPRHLDGLEPGERIRYYRTLADYQALRRIVDAEGDTHVAVVGGGYIGGEVAAGLARSGAAVTLVHPEPALLSQMFPEPVLGQVKDAFAAGGVEVRSGLTVQSGTESPDGVELTLSDGSTLSADAVVVGLGIEPAGQLAGDSGLEVSDDGGIVVDKHLRTLDEAVLAAGDVASYPDPVLGQRRVEHEDNAVSMGGAAGRIMAGSDEVYDHTPMFYSDLFDLGYEAVGTLDASLETVVVDKGEGTYVVYYLDRDSVVGVLLWGVWDSTNAAIAVIGSSGRPTSFDDLI